MSRQTELLGKIAQEFADLNYIDGNFTTKNDVSAGDMIATFGTASKIIKGYLQLPESEQLKIQLLGAGVPADVTRTVSDGMRMKEIIKELKS